MKTVLSTIASSLQFRVHHSHGISCKAVMAFPHLLHVSHRMHSAKSLTVEDYVPGKTAVLDREAIFAQTAY